VLNKNTSAQDVLQIVFIKIKLFNP